MLAAAGVLVISRSIAKPLADITRVTEAVAAGDVSTGGAVQRAQRRDRRAGALDRACSSTPCATTKNSIARCAATPKRARAAPGADVGRDRALLGRGRSDAGRAWPHFRPDAGGVRASSPAAADEASAKTASAAAGLVGGLLERARHRVRRRRIIRVGERDRPPGGAVQCHRHQGGERGRAHQHRGQGTGRGGRPHRRRGQADHRHRRADQSAGAQRHHRGGARRRGRARLRRGGRRGEGAGRRRPAAPPRRSARRSPACSAPPCARSKRSPSIEHTIREIGDISGAIAAAVTEQGAATAEIARSVEIAAKRTVETADEVGLVGTATDDTRSSAGAVKTVADDLGSVAGRIRGQVDAVLPAAERLIQTSRTPPGYGAASGRARPGSRRNGYRGSRRRDGRPARFPPPRRCAASAARSPSPRRSSRLARAFTSTKISMWRRARDDVDLAERAFPAPRQDAVAVRDQPGRRAALRRNAEAESAILAGLGGLRPAWAAAACRYAAPSPSSFASASAR